MPMLEGKSRSEVDHIAVGHEVRQRRQMLLALALLLVALILVVIKDRQFWFPSEAVSQSETEDQSASVTPSQAQAGKKAGSVVPPRKKARERAQVAAVAPAAAQTPSPTVVNRAALPPLEIEVVAGNEHRTISSGNPSLKVDLQPSGQANSAAGAASTAGVAGSTTATERVRLSPQTAQVVSRPVQPNYPLLAKQMKVQGSVILQALIGKDGLIQDLQVVSGPAILASAAQEAVKQWRFKPYYEAGQPIETEARITVNFTISAN